MRKGFWLRRAVVAFLVLLAASAGFSRLLRTGRVHGYLSARLAGAFGRPVEVGDFSFSLLEGLRLQADSITVTEDPRFGHEYFLRAERLTAGLRWRSLACGRFEFGTLSFARPSLNLVQAADGHWNVESWLPLPAQAAGVAPVGANPAARLYRIEVDTGRINFKHGVDKSAFALVDVRGHLEQESAGRWRIDLAARPMRATVVLQEVGTLRLRGRIAGTSARLQPADLALTWQEASLADALRLARGQDFGARGRLAMELTARSVAPGVRWFFVGAGRLTRVHRWDLPQRPRDPALNLRVEAQWRPGEARVELTKWALEAPKSSVQGTGVIPWGPAFHPQLRLASSGVSFSDWLAWYRAFRTGVAEDLTLEGYAVGEFALSGWPLRLEQGVLASNGALLRVAGLGEPLRLGRLTARVVRGRLEFAPTTIALPASGSAGGQARQSNALRLAGAVGPAGGLRAQPREWKFEVNLVGQTDRGEDLLAAAFALGSPLYSGWNVEGPAGLNLRWQGSVLPFAAQPIGSIELRGLRLRTGFLNQPVTLANARIELRPGEWRVTLAAALAFGAHWKGTLSWPGTSAGGGMAVLPPWEFDLSADHLDATEFDRWLGPRARPALLERILPFGTAGRDSAALDATLAHFRARGSIYADEVVVSPLSLRRLRAQAEIAGRNITLRAAQADFYGGAVRGSLRAELSAQPSYRLEAEFERVQLGSLAEATAKLKGRLGGVASGALQLAARGIGRENLLASLEGRGKLKVRSAQMRGLDVKASYFAEGAVQGATQFALAEAAFSLGARKVQVERLRLSDRGDDFEAVGNVDFSRALDFRIRQPGRPRDNRSQGPASKTVHVTGPLDAPRVTLLGPETRSQ